MTNLVTFLKRHEGYREKTYICPAGKKTWGYGRNIEDNPLDEEEVEYLLTHGIEAGAENCLRNDISSSLFSCRMIFEDFDQFSVNRQIALCSIMFNLGLPKFEKFKKMIKAINRKDWKEAAVQLKDSKRHKQIPMRSDEESDMLLKG